MIKFSLLICLFLSFGSLFSQTNRSPAAKEYITGIKSDEFISNSLPGYVIGTSYIRAVYAGKEYVVYHASETCLISPIVYENESNAHDSYESRLKVPSMMSNRESNIAGDESQLWGKGTVYKAGVPGGLGDSNMVLRRNNVILSLKCSSMESIKTISKQLDNGLLHGNEKNGITKGVTVILPVVKEHPFSRPMKLNENYKGTIVFADPGNRPIDSYISAENIQTDLPLKSGPKSSIAFNYSPKKVGLQKVNIYLLNDLNVANHIVIDAIVQ